MFKLNEPLYHGTSSVASIMIVGGYGFHSPLYLTTSKARAEHYAKAATAYLEVQAKEGGQKLFADGYAIFTFRSLPNEDFLRLDDYSPNEPDQFKYLRPLKGLNHFTCERHALDVTGEEHMSLQCFAIGMWRR